MNVNSILQIESTFDVPLTDKCAGLQFRAEEK
jgi:hypothetical protein